jgi:hypothetical protein
VDGAPVEAPGVRFVQPFYVLREKEPESREPAAPSPAAPEPAAPAPGQERG